MVGADETGEVVHVAVGVVALDAVAEPDDLLHSEPASRRRASISSRERSGLRFGLRRQLSVVMSAPSPVHVDRAALEHEVPAIEYLEAKASADLGRHVVVVVAGRVFPSPGIVAEVDDSEARRLLAAQEDRPVVAAPWLVCGDDGTSRRARVEPTRIEGASHFGSPAQRPLH